MSKPVITDAETKINKTLQEKAATLDRWQEKLDHLEKEIKKVKREIQLKYEDEIRDLRQELNSLQVRLQAMHEGGTEEWISGRNNFEERFEALHQNILKTATQVNEENENVALGWLQGFTDERPHNSAGWVEGMGEKVGETEGWAEGMGQRGPDSKGWSEGYDKQ